MSDLSDKDRQVLLSLCERDWNLWDKCREQSTSHKAYTYAHLKQVELDGVMAKLRQVC